MNDSDDNDSAFLDLLMLALAGFVAIVILLLPYISPPGDESHLPPGNLIIEIIWPNEIDADVDLWVQAPNQRPVWYSNKDGPVLNLLRDDLGTSVLDLAGINAEIVYSRGLPAGEYVVNLHLYRNNSGIAPIPVTVRASVKPGPQTATKEIAAKRVSLNFTGEELTVFRFTADDAGDVSSINDLPKKLRDATK